MSMDLWGLFNLAEMVGKKGPGTPIAGIDENPDNIRDKATKIVSKLLALSPIEQEVALVDKPEFSKINSMIREGATLEAIVKAFKISGDPSIVFPRSTEISAIQDKGWGMVDIQNPTLGNGGEGGGR